MTGCNQSSSSTRPVEERAARLGAGRGLQERWPGPRCQPGPTRAEDDTAWGDIPQLMVSVAFPVTSPANGRGWPERTVTPPPPDPPRAQRLIRDGAVVSCELRPLSTDLRRPVLSGRTGGGTAGRVRGPGSGTTAAGEARGTEYYVDSWFSCRPFSLPHMATGKLQGRRIRVLRVREHPLNMEVHPLTAKSTPSKWKENLMKHRFKQISNKVMAFWCSY